MAYFSTRKENNLPETFQAWRVFEQQAEDGTFRGMETTVKMEDLWANNKKHHHSTHTNKDNTLVTIRVTHSSLNYKDALSAMGKKGGVTRKYPHTPGIDAAGYIVCEHNQQQEGEETTTTTTIAQQPSPQQVLVTGYDLGMNTDGGFGEYITVPKEWVIHLPAECDNWGNSNPRQPMIYGTAGLTAGLLVHRLLQRGDAVPGQSVAVAGATGAVGSVAVEILARLGFQVTAITGKTDQTTTIDFLTELGAQEILSRDVLQESPKPLLSPRFDHGIDTVGGAPLVALLKQIQPDGSVACCGLAAGAQLPHATVLPFILRGVQLLGVDSVEIPRSLKTAVWQKLAHEWACPVTESKVRDIGRHQLGEALDLFLQGKSFGKIVLDHALTRDVNDSNNSNR